MIRHIIKDTEIRMMKSIEIFKDHINKIRSNSLSPNILDGIQVEYCGTSVPLRQLANITVENSRTLKITMFDHAVGSSVKKAIISSNLGFNPISLGNSIRINIPMLTEERRKELIKLVRIEVEQTRIIIRNIRRDANEKIKSLLKNKKISTDDDRRAQERIQKITTTNINKLELILKDKEKELMQF